MGNGSQPNAVQGDTFVLRFVSGKYEGTERTLSPGDELVVGRAKNLGLVLVEDKVSRRHARIINDTGAIIVEDLGSTNGTFVNGERITTAALKEGDRLLVGTSVATISRADADHARESTESTSAAPPAPEPEAAPVEDLKATHAELPAVPARSATAPPPPPPSSMVGELPSSDIDGDGDDTGAQDIPPPPPASEPAVERGTVPPPAPPASDIDMPVPASAPRPVPPPAEESEPQSAPSAPPAAQEDEPQSAPTAPPPGDRRTDPGRRTASVSGFIEEVALPDLLQLLSAGRKTGVLYVHGQREAEIFLRGGQIENCRVAGSSTSDPQKLLYRVMNWREGQFELSSGEYDGVDKEIATPTQELILEAARQADELGDLAANMPPLDAELMVSLPLEPPLRDLSPEQLDTLQFIYNHGRVETVLDKAPGTDLDTYQHIAHLVDNGYVKIA